MNAPTPGFIGKSVERREDGRARAQPAPRLPVDAVLGRVEDERVARDELRVRGSVSGHLRSSTGHLRTAGLHR